MMFDIGDRVEYFDVRESDEFKAEKIGRIKDIKRVDGPEGTEVLYVIHDSTTLTHNIQTIKEENILSIWENGRFVKVSKA